MHHRVESIATRVNPFLEKGCPSVDTIVNFGIGTVAVLVALTALAVAAFYARLRYKVPSAGEALVITGGKSLRVLPGRGAFVSPLHKHQFFPLKVMTVRSGDQETQTSTLVPVVVMWTAQLRADTDTVGALDRAVTGFADYDPATISASLQQTLDGEVRGVIGTMTPEAIVKDKDAFATKVTEGVQPRMQELGFKLVSLNITDVTDRNGHYDNLAAKDREDRRREAEILTAQANQQVAVEAARADEASQTAGLARDQAVAEKTREVTLRQAAIKAETDQAQADAAIAGQLQTELRNQELETRQGQVAVVREEQLQAAAAARREVATTEAETERQRAEIAARAAAQQAEIEAHAAAVVAKEKAEGEAAAEVALAEGRATAAAKDAEARTAEIRQTGLAEAEVARAKGEAEAAATLAKGQADAEVLRLEAEALAAHDGANLRVRLAQIESDTTVRVFTTVAEVMGRIGEHATFIDMGGGSNGGGDLLSRVLGNLPGLLKQLDVSSMALHGQPFGDAVGSVVAAATGRSMTDTPEPPAVVVGPEPEDQAVSAEVPLPEAPEPATEAEVLDDK